MANTCSVSNDMLMLDNDTSLDKCNSDDLLSDKNLTDTTFINDETSKYRIIPQNSCEISDEILEIQQIEYEQHLILDQINRIDSEKQRLHDLLNLLQSTKSNDKKKNTKRTYRRLKCIDSNSEFE